MTDGTRLGPAQLDYVLPLRWNDDAGLEELTGYLRWLSSRARVIVVDGSPPELFSRHATAWRGLLAEHVPPDRDTCLNGKVAGVHTGMALARAERVVIADDDVRYDDHNLAQVVDLLDVADLVGPQNVFRPMPWHARWDTARSLLNRALGADYPGTFAVRSSTFRHIGGYDGDVLFENLELMRTVRAAGGRVLRPRSVYVVRHPPTARHFWGQRVRQAYDDLAQPWRLAAMLAVLPAVGSLLRQRRFDLLGAAALASVVVAEVGRRRGGGRTEIPGSASWLAPLWTLERASCIWAAVALRVTRGGVAYADRRMRVAAHSPRTIKRRLALRSVASRRPAGGRPEVRRLVGAVAEGLERRATAPAEGDGAAAGVDLLAVRRHDLERPADQERSVRVWRDGGLGVR